MENLKISRFSHKCFPIGRLLDFHFYLNVPSISCKKEISLEQLLFQKKMRFSFLFIQSSSNTYPILFLEYLYSLINSLTSSSQYISGYGKHPSSPSTPYSLPPKSKSLPKYGKPILKNRLSRLKYDKATLKSRFSRLKYDKATLKSRFSRLKYDKATLKSRFSRLKYGKATLKSRFSRLNYDKATLKSRFSRLKCGKATLASLISRLKNGKSTSKSLIPLHSSPHFPLSTLQDHLMKQIYHLFSNHLIIINSFSLTSSCPLHIYTTYKEKIKIRKVAPMNS